jgi:hypothetical protein
MWSRSYRKHVIMAFPSFDTVTNSWAPQADISWPTGPERQSEFVRFPLRVMTESEAVAYALRKGESWIDNRLKAHRAENPTTFMVNRTSHLRSDFRKTDFKPPAKSAAAIRDDSSAAFTFAQFKFAVVRPGIKISETALRKSYSGLMQLQKNRNCSTAEIRATVKRAQDLLPSRSTRRLPMTERAWRKIA